MQVARDDTGDWPAAESDPPTPIDAVLVWITPTIGRDYSARSVFPELCTANANAHQGGSALYYLTLTGASALLADARAQIRVLKWHRRTAYRRHARSIIDAMRTAKARPGLFERAEPVCDWKNEYSEGYHGTKDQIATLGITLAGPWPGEPGFKRRARTVDKRGYEARIKRAQGAWAVFEVVVTLPVAIASAGDRGKEIVERAKRELDNMPTSERAFRCRLLGNLRSFVRIPLDTASEPPRFHGYRLDPGSLDEIFEAFDVAIEAVIGAKVTFDPVVHEKVRSKHLAEIAAADPSFQATISALTRPNGAILQGERL